MGGVWKWRVLSALAFAPWSGALPAQEYHVDLDAPRRVVFISSTPVDEFEGVSEAIDGYVLLDGQGVRPTPAPGDTEVYFEVDLASLDTGIGLRNRHMRENYLEVDEHPWATLEGSIQGMEAREDGVLVRVEGLFTVHGVSRRVRIPCDATPRGPRFNVRCAFSVQLEDHDIEIPRLMFLRLAPEVRVELEFTLAPAGP